MSLTGAERGIVTPEAVRLELETAGVGSRTLAFLLDLVIMGAILSSLSTLFFAISTGIGRTWVAIALGVLLTAVVIFGYPMAFEVLWRGRTPGKAAVGLRVVTREGGPVRVRHAAVRAILGLIDFLGTLGAAAVLSVLVTRDDQRLGDLAAGTLVLRERVAQPSSVAVRFPPPRGLESWVAAFDVSRLDERGYGLARALLLRGGSLPAEARQRLAREVAEAVVKDVSTPPPPARIGPEVFLQCVAAAYQARHAPAWAAPTWPAPAAAPSAGAPPSPFPGPYSSQYPAPYARQYPDGYPTPQAPFQRPAPPSEAGGGAAGVAAEDGPPAPRDAGGFARPD